MGVFSFLKRGSGPRRVFVISLDGVPHSFLARHLPEGAFPNLARLFADGDLRRMTTAQPPVSPVVWASYATGMNPGRHGVYGLVERRPGGYDMFLPGSHDLAAPPMWDVLGSAGSVVPGLRATMAISSHSLIVPMKMPASTSRESLIWGFDGRL